MRARAFVAGVAALVAAAVIAALPASAADVGRRGPLLIDVVGTFGEPLAKAPGVTELPFRGLASFSKLVEATGDVDGKFTLMVARSDSAPTPVETAWAFAGGVVPHGNYPRLPPPDFPSDQSVCAKSAPVPSDDGSRR